MENFKRKFSKFIVFTVTTSWKKKHVFQYVSVVGLVIRFTPKIYAVGQISSAHSDQDHDQDLESR